MSLRSTTATLAFLYFIGIIFRADANGQNELTDIPMPDPAAELAAMQVAEVAEINLFAADPDIAKPIQMNFDSTGGLWIASSSVYPQIRPGEVADDKIIVLRDTDGDGVSDRRTVFADGLLIPTGVLPDGPHAAYVAESTRLLYLTDTDGDGVADDRRVVLSGFGTEDTHHLVHTLRFGPDGCVYFNQSIYIHSHFDTPYGTRHLDGGGIWRYRPTTGELDVFAKGFINPWGHSFDASGESFVTDGAFFEGINYAFPDSVFVTSPGATRWLPGLNPGSPKHCGLEILSGTHIPPQWSGSLVTSDFRSHRVCRFTVKPSASGYISRQQPEIVTTPHVAFRPIDARMGGDGALYVADWYNPIIQHGEVDFRDPRRDRTHGRIWRVSFPGRPLDPWPKFSDANIDNLLKYLRDDSLAVRQFARQELWNRAVPDDGLANPKPTSLANREPTSLAAGVVEAVRDWVDKDYANRALEMLWIAEVVSLTDPGVLEQAMRRFDSIDADDRRTVLRSVWRGRLRFEVDAAVRQDVQAFVLGRTGDDDPRVRLEAVVCAGQLSGVDAMSSVLQATTRELDDNLDFAVWQSTRAIADRYAADNADREIGGDASKEGGRSILSEMNWTDRTDQLAHAIAAIRTPAAAQTAVDLIGSATTQSSSRDLQQLVSAIASAGDADQLGQLAKDLLIEKKIRSLDPLLPLIERTERDKTVPAGIDTILAKVVTSADDLADDRVWAMAIAKMAMVWKVQALEGVIAESIDATDDQDLKMALVASLGTFDTKTATKKLEKLMESGDAGVRVSATSALINRRPDLAIAMITEMLADPRTSQVGDESAIDLAVSLAARPWLADKFAKAVGQAKLSTDVARRLLRRVRGAGGNDALETAIQTAGLLDQAAWKLTPELTQVVSERVVAEGSPERGEAIYRRESLQCIACHAIGSGGGLVGPNLISLGGAAQLDYILEALIDPSAKLKEGYTTRSMLTDEGQIVNGIVIGETAEAIRMRLADGNEVRIDVDSIESEKPGKSLMPAGLVDSLTRSELIDLVAFLSSLGRTAPYTVSTEPLVRSMETLVFTPEANRRLNRTSTDTAATDDPAMTWRTITTTVDGKLPLGELDKFQQHKQTPPTSFVRFEVKLPAAGTVKVDVPTEGIEAWVDGKPTPVWNLQSLKLDTGNHKVVLAIDRSKQNEPISIRMTGDAIP